MAAGDTSLTHIQQYLMDIIHCCICTETYTNPKNLPCGHTFCLKCLEGFGGRLGKRSGDEMSCPMCRTAFVIPEKGFGDLSPNVYIESVKGLAELTETFTFCDQHEGKQLEIFCDDCKKTLCVSCFLGSHKTHNVVETGSAADRFRQEIREKIKTVLECKSRAKDMMENLAQEEAIVYQKFYSLEALVLNTRDELYALIDKHTDAVIETLTSLKDEKLKEIDSEKERLNCHTTSLDDYEINANRVTESRGSVLICRVAEALVTEAGELEKRNISTSHQQLIPPFQATFSKTNIECLLETRNIVGEIGESPIGQQIGELHHILEESQSLQHQNDEESDKNEERNDNKIEERNESDNDSGDNHLHAWIKPRLLKRITTKASVDDNSPVTGVTLLDKELFIVGGKNSLVEVYDSTSYSFLRRWDVPKFVDPEDITSCDTNKCLYVIDWNLESRRPSEILRLDSCGTLITKWFRNVGLGRLAAAHDTNIILTLFKENRIVEFSPVGEVVHVIDFLKASLNHLVHAVKLSTGHFLLCHGNGKDPKQRICRVDRKGNISRCFNPQKIDLGKLNGPNSLAVTRNGWVLVADSNMVFLLNSDLEYQRRLLSSAEGLRKPGRMHFDASGGRLFVADNKTGWHSGQLYVFDINNCI